MRHAPVYLFHRTFYWPGDMMEYHLMPHHLIVVFVLLAILVGGLVKIWTD